MKKWFIVLLILVLGVASGVTLGYYSLLGISKVYSFGKEASKKIDLSFIFQKQAQGGPEANRNYKDANSFFSSYQESYKISDNAPVPNVTALSYLVGDLDTGEIILSKNENKPLPIASISKLMTAVVADEKFGLSQDVFVSDFALETYGKQGELKRGERYKVSEILYPLLLESSNDAAEAIAESAGRDAFLMSMNEKSREIEMYNTHFSDPSGLSENNISSVTDLFKLSQYIEKYRSYIFGITRLKQYKIGKKLWFNNSKFRSDDEYYGGKNGYTDFALKTQLAIFEMPFGDQKKKIIFIILKTDDIYGDIYGLKKYVERHVKFE